MPRPWEDRRTRGRLSVERSRNLAAEKEAGMEEQDHTEGVEGELTDEDVEAHLIKEALAAGAAAGAMFAGANIASASTNPLPPPTPAQQAQAGVEIGALPNAAVVTNQATKAKKGQKAKKSQSQQHVGRNTNVNEK